jgi:hypothetical protein
VSFINWGSESPEQRDSRHRFEEELMLLEQTVRFIRLTSAQSGAAGGSIVDASANQYVENGYIDNYFE